MKIVKIFGVVMAVHAAVFMFVFAIPGCRSTGKKPAPAATTVAGSDLSSPLTASETSSPVVAPTSSSSETAAVRFSPTRPGTVAAAEVTAPPPPATYTVAKGDNLWTIAKKNGVTVKQLTAANNLRSDSTLKLGQKLVIPGKAGTAETAPAASSVAAPAAHATASTSHVVKAGETLGSIAKKYQVKVGDIATANNIADPTKIRVGQSLKIPGGKAPSASKSATAAKPSVAPAAAPAAEPAPAPAPAAPVFTSPLMESAPSSTSGSPLITPAPEPSDAPVIRVEESGAPKIE